MASGLICQHAANPNPLLNCLAQQISKENRFLIPFWQFSKGYVLMFSFPPFQLVLGSLNYI